MKRKSISQFELRHRFVLFPLLACSAIVLAVFIAAETQRIIPEISISYWIVAIGSIALCTIAVWWKPGIMLELPVWVKETMRSYPIRALGFIFFAVLSMVQIARLSVHNADPSSPWWILTSNEFWSKHECGTAYFHAVELHERGEKNIYLADHYPVLNRNAQPHTDIKEMRVEDAYQYPPQFLLLPKLLLSISHHYPTLRMIWLAMQIISISFVLVLLADYVGGKRGRWMAMFAPFVLAAPAALYVYQYSQFHFLAIALAIVGMIAFEKNRNVLGGLLLAIAILGKIFPGFLLILLAAEKRWKPVAWTLAMSFVITVITLGVFGTAPFVAFIDYQLPRLHSFAAFAFLDVWPEVRFELLTANLSPQGQVMKLAEMGVPGMTQGFAIAVNTFCAVVLIGLCAIAARRMNSTIRRAQAWLSILGLASLISPAAWGDYVTLPALWLITTFAVDAAANRKFAWFVSMCGVFFYFLVGLVPLGTFPSPQTTYVLSTISFVLLIGMLSWSLLRRTSRFKQESIQPKNYFERNVIRDSAIQQPGLL